MNTILFRTISRPDIVLLFNNITSMPTKSLDEVFLSARGFTHIGGRSQLNMYMDDIETFTDFTLIAYATPNGSVHEYLSIDHVNFTVDEDDPLSVTINIEFVVPSFLSAGNEVIPYAAHYSNGATVRYFCKDPIGNGETFYSNGKPAFITDSDLRTDFDDFYVQMNSSKNVFMLSGVKDIPNGDIPFAKDAVHKIAGTLNTAIAHHVQKIAIESLHGKEATIFYSPDALVVQKCSFQRGMVAFTLVLYFKKPQDDPTEKIFLAK